MIEKKPMSIKRVPLQGVTVASKSPNMPRVPDSHYLEMKHIVKKQFTSQENQNRSATPGKGNNDRIVTIMQSTGKLDGDNVSVDDSCNKKKGTGRDKSANSASRPKYVPHFVEPNIDNIRKDSNKKGSQSPNSSSSSSSSFEQEEQPPAEMIDSRYGIS